MFNSFAFNTDPYNSVRALLNVIAPIIPGIIVPLLQKQLGPSLGNHSTMLAPIEKSYSTPLSAQQVTVPLSQSNINDIVRP